MLVQCKLAIIRTICMLVQPCPHTWRGLFNQLKGLQVGLYPLVILKVELGTYLVTELHDWKPAVQVLVATHLVLLHHFAYALLEGDPIVVIGTSVEEEEDVWGTSSAAFCKWQKTCDLYHMWLIFIVSLKMSFSPSSSLIASLMKWFDHCLSEKWFSQYCACSDVQKGNFWEVLSMTSMYR